jgi:predicted ribosome-associated RNA-binding protein Tma20
MGIDSGVIRGIVPGADGFAPGIAAMRDGDRIT